MKYIYPKALLLSIFALPALWALLPGVGLHAAKRVPISEEKVHADYGFTREVFENCPIEKAELDTATNEIILSFPREEYRDLRQHLEHRGWAEKGTESGEFHLGGAVILVGRGEVTLAPHSLAGR